MSTKVPFIDLKVEYQEIQGEIQEAVMGVVESGWFILGPELERFENDLAALCGVKHAFGVGSGTDALFIALKALGIGPGDEVITVSHSFIATALAITFTGAMPVFVDIDPVTYTIDSDCTRAAITERTQAVMPVHLYGQPADMAAIMALADEYGLGVVEDACQAHGAAFQDQKAGSIGHLGCFSFYPTKNLGAYGDGGAVVTNDPQLADRVRLYRNYGQREKYFHKSIGTNSRLDEIQAAVLRVKLRHLEGNNRRRQEAALSYDARLREYLTIPAVGADRNHVYHLYVIRSPQRQALQEHLTKNGIGSLIHYPVPIHQQDAYASLGLKDGFLPVTEQVAQEVLSLPIYPQLTSEQILEVVGGVKTFFE